MLNSIIYTLDSYKQIHHAMYPDGTESVYSYFEARNGSRYPYTVFFGLQYILKKWLIGSVVTKEMIDEAEPILKEHFKYNGDVWSRDKWDYIVSRHNGKLPIYIKSVPEGMIVPVGNVLMTVEVTDPKCYWLTNALETVLQQVWYPTTVCTRSFYINSFIREKFKNTVDDDKQWLADFYHHDFGQRGASCMEQAGIGGMAHLVNSKGTDSDMAIPFAINYYNAEISKLAFSVPATEHSIATSLGQQNEFVVTKDVIKKFPHGILSVVSDSYSISNALLEYTTSLKQDILERDGKFVVRPDSPRWVGDDVKSQVLWIANVLSASFGSGLNSKGYIVLNPKVGIIYGDGLSEEEIKDTINYLIESGYAASTCVFGQGGGLLQKLDRDTCRFAFKCSAQKRNGEWHDVYKKPQDKTKISKSGRLKLIWDLRSNNLKTVNENIEGQDELVPIFKDGKILEEFSFEEIRKRVKGFENYAKRIQDCERV